jgi:hypothetical protein
MELEGGYVHSYWSVWDGGERQRYKRVWKHTVSCRQDGHGKLPPGCISGLKMKLSGP